MRRRSEHIVSEEELRAVCRTLAIDGVVQIGLGYMRELPLLRSCAGDVPFVAFEPLQKFVNLAAKKHYPGQVVRAAVSDQDGEAVMFCEREQSSLQQFSCRTMWLDTVRTVRLDDQRRRITPLRQMRHGLLWIDVQGAELKVLSGASATLRRMAVVMCECHENQRPPMQGVATCSQIVQKMVAEGFASYGRLSIHELLFVRRRECRVLQRAAVRAGNARGG